MYAHDYIPCLRYGALIQAAEIEGGTGGSHNILSSTHTDVISGGSTVTRGAIMYGNSTPKWSRLPLGTTGYTLLSDGSDVAWGQIANAGISSSAAIALSKLAPGTANYVPITDGSTVSYGSIANANISTVAAIALSKLASATGSAMLVLSNSSNVPTYTDLTGDIAISNAGVSSIVSGVIVNADINASAAVAESKLAFDTAAGHHHDGADSRLVSVGNATSLTQTGTFECGGNDLTWVFGTQTTAGKVAIEDLNLSSGTAYFVFTTSTQALTNKTYEGLTIDTTTGTFDLAAGKTLKVDNTLTFNGTDSTTFAFPGSSGSVTVLDNNTVGSGYIVLATSPTLVTPTLGVASATSINKIIITAPASGGTLTISDGKTLGVSNILTLAGTDNTTMTFPSSSGSVSTCDSTNTFTNKSINADGTGNVITNINGDEVDSVAATTNTYTLPIILNVANAGAGTVTITAPSFKSMLIDAWAIDTQGGNAGNWKFTDGINDITSTVSYAGTDTLISRADSIDDALYSIGSGSTFYLINSNAADTSRIWVMLQRID